MLPNEPSLRTKKGNYYLVFYDSDRQPKQKWVPLRTQSKRTAERRAKPITSKWMQDTLDPWTDDPHNTVPTADEAVTSYLQARKADLSDRTWKTYKYDLTPFGEHFEGRRIDKIAPEEIEGWCRRDDTSARTVEKRTTEVATMYRYFFTRGRIKNNPASALSSPTPDSTAPRYLTRDEYTALKAEIRAYIESYDESGDGPVRQQAPLRWLLYGLRLMVTTGLRRGSLIALRWPDIDFEDERVYVRAGDAKTDGYTVPLFENTRSALEDLGPEDSGRVLTREDGSAVPARLFTRQFNRFAGKADLPDVSPHTCRHTFASWLVQAGVPLYKVSSWMGHSSIEVTERYAHLAPTQSDDTAEQVFS